MKVWIICALQFACGDASATLAALRERREALEAQRADIVATLEPLLREIKESSNFSSTLGDGKRKRAAEATLSYDGGDEATFSCDGEALSAEAPLSGQDAEAANALVKMSTDPVGFNFGRKSPRCAIPPPPPAADRLIKEGEVAKAIALHGDKLFIPELPFDEFQSPSTSPVANGASPQPEAMDTAADAAVGRVTTTPPTPGTLERADQRSNHTSRVYDGTTSIHRVYDGRGYSHEGQPTGQGYVSPTPTDQQNLGSGGAFYVWRRVGASQLERQNFGSDVHHFGPGGAFFVSA